MRVRLTQLDGALPNLAIMKLAHWHKAQGDEIFVTKEVEPLFHEKEVRYDRVYGSAIFDFSQARVARFKSQWADQNCIVGGTGVPSQPGVDPVTVESLIGVKEYEHYDYSGYPSVKYSIGFSQRGCRLRCGHCCVPGKEGKNRPVNRIEEIWRGGSYPRKLHLLDNDFFGNPEWRERIAEIRDGQFKVCISQGINVRLITSKEIAESLASIDYMDGAFDEPRLYTAWDRIKDERIFFRGIDLLTDAGIPADQIFVYMLIGYDPKESWDLIWTRFHKMVARGLRPFPMVYDRSRWDLMAFARWVNRGLYRICTWLEYRRETKTRESVDSYLRMAPLFIRSSCSLTSWPKTSPRSSQPRRSAVRKLAQQSNRSPPRRGLCRRHEGEVRTDDHVPHDRGQRRGTARYG
jgi:hypothetical protein